MADSVADEREEDSRTMLDMLAQLDDRRRMETDQELYRIHTMNKVHRNGVCMCNCSICCKLMPKTLLNPVVFPHLTSLTNLFHLMKSLPQDSGFQQHFCSTN